MRIEKENSIFQNKRKRDVMGDQRERKGEHRYREW